MEKHHDVKLSDSESDSNSSIVSTEQTDGDTKHSKKTISNVSSDPNKKAVISTATEPGKRRQVEAKIPNQTLESEQFQLTPEEAEQLKVLPDYRFRSKIALYWQGQRPQDSRWISHIEWEYRTKQHLDRQARKWDFTIGGINDIMGARRPCLDITSPYIIKVIRDVVKLDHTLNQASDRIFMTFPFPTLFHHWESIETAIEKDKDAGENDKIDFEAFKFVYTNHSTTNNSKETFENHHELIRRYLKAGNILSPDIWAVYKPGSQVILRDRLGEWQMLVVVSCEPEEGNGYSRKVNHGWKLSMWQMIWDNSKECFTRTLWSFSLRHFSGTRQVSTLPVIPLDYYEDKGSTLSKLEAKNQLLQKLTERGNKWADFVRNDPPCLYYEGAAIKLDDNRQESGPPSPLPTVNLKGRVVVDQERYFSIRNLYDGLKWEGGVTAADDRPEYSGFDNHPRDKGFESTGFQAMLCPAAVLCFHMDSQTWNCISSNRLKRVPWRSELIERLELDVEKKDMLVNLVEGYRTNKNQGVQDLIQGKGEGLVILLHGPPGVGKTLTAEIVAEHLQQPLQSISLSTLANYKGDFESYLEDMFQQASRQNVILLLDEADVILEERAFEDVRRNSIVSIFLRTIEYFNGIVFLTTNRPGTIDGAFESRIHLSIEYPKLNSLVRTELWLQFLQNLEPRDVADVKDDIDSLKQYDLNGRQIRNVINVAAAIARARSGGVLKIEIVKKLAGEAEGMFKRLENANSSKSRPGRDSRAGFYGRSGYR